PGAPGSSSHRRRSRRPIRRPASTRPSRRRRVAAMKASWVSIALLAGCGGGRKAPLDDALVPDCVSGRRARRTTRERGGNHPDYAPDYGTVFRKGRDGYEELRYHAGNDHLRLWIDHGRVTGDVPYELELVEDSQYVLRYKLTLDEAVFGSKQFDGVLAKSY